MAAAGAGCAGNWKFEFETPMGPTTTMMKLTQNGDQLTGKAADPSGAEVDVSGTCKGDTIQVTQKVQSPMGELTLTFTGMVSGKSITGSVKLGDFGEAPFTGTKQ